ncbi:flavodoxin domain-containing protein [Isoptericola sp. b490]|uniref:flavodoxin domain-containing protein n=1 Tax=Actinotalea lenta TaxID=3064654 RepID=UPI002713DE72|nr:flavodoxin domain-containing protein [Isoptericola sp. b490]MDO8121278.1 flavodoxin domain-containing protein [Isoptericola sp. b490]
MRTALVVHASRHGSTRELAEAVGRALADAGLTVDVRDAADRRDLDSPDLVVVGGALYRGRWHARARRFLTRHRRELTERRVAVFGSGPRRDTPEAWGSSRAQLDRALARSSWLTPYAVTVFGGADPASGKQRRDVRDWEAVRAWAAGLVTP